MWQIALQAKNKGLRRAFGCFSGFGHNGRIALGQKESGVLFVFDRFDELGDAVFQPAQPRPLHHDPAEYTMDTIPAPKDERVVIKEMPGRKMAAVRYGGSWSRKLYDRKEQALREFIAEKGLTITGEPTWARYNPPFWPSFMRRNEILFPVR